MTKTKTNDKDAYHVGQTLYCVRRHSDRKPETMTIAKIGHTWLHLMYSYGGHYFLRANKETLKCEESDVEIFLSKEVYDASVARDQAWHKIANYCYRTHRTPDGISIEDIQAAAKLLRVPQ